MKSGVCKQCSIDIPLSNKFCSKSCAATFNNLARSFLKPKKHCFNCNKILSYPQKKYCCIACQQPYRWDNLKTLIITNKEAPSHRIGRRFLLEKDGHKCSLCDLNEWQDKEIPLVLDHIDGNSDNNLLVNLRMICCNCDALLPTYKNRNKGNGRHARRQRYKDNKSY